jgi:hypothetical protein
LGEGHSIDWHSAGIADGCGSEPNTNSPLVAVCAQMTSP